MLNVIPAITLFKYSANVLNGLCFDTRYLTVHTFSPWLYRRSKLRLKHNLLATSDMYQQLKL